MEKQHYFNIYIKQGFFCNNSQILNLVCNNIVIEKNVEQENIKNHLLNNFVHIFTNFKNSIQPKLILEDNTIINLRVHTINYNNYYLLINININEDFNKIPQFIKNSNIKIILDNNINYETFYKFINKHTQSKDENNDTILKNQENLLNEISNLKKIVLNDHELIVNLDKKIKLFEEFMIMKKLENQNNNLNVLNNSIKNIEENIIKLDNKNISNNNLIDNINIQIKDIYKELKEVLNIIEDSKELIYKNSEKISNIYL